MTSVDPIAAATSCLSRHPELELAIVFGSVSGGRHNAQSDLDIAVQAAQPLSVEQKMQLIGDLAQVCGRAIDLIDLRTVGEPLLGQILSHGRRIFGSERSFAALLHKHLLDAADFLPYAQRIVAQRRHSWIAK